MWVRQCDLDAQNEAPLPIPSRIASNEEFFPPPQSSKQREYETRLLALSATAAKKQGLSRRDFLRSGSGMAAALFALNQTFGNVYDVSAAEVQNQQAFAEKWPKDQFIFDIQTHHVDVSKKWYDDTDDGKRVASFFRMLRRGKTIEDTLDQLNRVILGKDAEIRLGRREASARDAVAWTRKHRALLRLVRANPRLARLCRGALSLAGKHLRLDHRLSRQQ